MALPVNPATFSGHRAPVYALVQGEYPGRFLSGSGDGSVVLWQVDRPDEGELLVNVGQAVFSLLITENGRILLIGTEGGGLHVVDLATRRERQHLDVHRRGLFSILSLPGGRVACAGGDGTLSIWQLDERVPRLELLRHIPLVEEKLRDLALAPTGDRLAVACGDGTLRILDTGLFNEHHTLDAHRGKAEGTTGAGCVAYHPSKPVLLSGGKDGHLRTWHVAEEHRPLRSIAAHKGGIYRIAIDSHAHRIATASRDRSAKIWDAATLDPVARYDRAAGGHTHSVNAVFWIGDTLITGSDDRTIKAWHPGP